MTLRNSSRGVVQLADVFDLHLDHVSRACAENAAINCGSGMITWLSRLLAENVALLFEHADDLKGPLADRRSSARAAIRRGNRLVATSRR